VAVMTAELNASGSGAALRPPGPTEILDRAMFLLRSGPVSRVGFGLSASIPLTTVCLALYYLEAIEGVRTLRGPFALLLAATFVFRANVLSRLAATFVRELRPGLPAPPREPTGRAFAKLWATASVAGFGVWVWLWPLFWLAQLSPFAIVALVPLLALRGGVAPSWLARLRYASEGGLRAFGLALDDAAGMRATLVFVELMLLGGMLGLFVNVFALTAMLLLLSHSILGLDVAFVSAFLSTENEFVTYGLLALCIVLFDPLRAAVSACVFADARGRKDGADLHAAVDSLLAAARPEPPGSIRPSRPGLTATGVLLLGLLAAPAHAEPAPQPPEAATAASNDTERIAESSEDLEIRVAVERILKRREFEEFEPKGPRTFETWIRNLLDKLLSKNSDQPEEARTLRVDLPDVSPWLVMTIVFGLLVFAVGYVSWESRGHSPALPIPPSPSQPPRISERPAPMLLSDARALAADGNFAGALRALYAATLAALDRARLIQFDPARTNGHYLRSMPAGATRDAFAAFTRLFDRKWYGREECTRAEYEQSLELAERICAVPSARPPAREPGSKRP
jgi:Domain of unknown function (DUF4129)